MHTSVVVGLSLLLLSPLASAGHHRRHRAPSLPTFAVAIPPSPEENAGATLPRAVPDPPSLAVPASFFDGKAALVRHDLLFFKERSNPENSAPRGGPYALDRPLDVPGFVPPPRVDDQLEMARQNDRVLLLRNQSPSLGSAGIGFAIFGAMTMTSAHAPAPLRLLFDGPVHVGPAMFEGGGMGGGLGGTLP